MSHTRAAHLRRRAAHLRTLAYEMQHTPSMTLQTHSTVDTWHGPQAQECNRALAGAQRDVHLAIDDLGDQAWRLDRDADALEAEAIRIDRLRVRQAEVAAEREHHVADPSTRVDRV